MSTSKQFFSWRPHPWHGISPGKDMPSVVTAYIEITAFDGVKYEIDKETGYLKVDRPQLNSSLPPSLYGFIPQTYCGKRVAQLSKGAADGDKDPMDICVLSERPVTRAEILVPARVVGGFRMIDKGEADDKIIAVLENDPYWAGVEDLSQISSVLLQRLAHYFLTYKMIPGKDPSVLIETTYGREDAFVVIQAALEDYQEEFGKK